MAQTAQSLLLMAQLPRSVNYTLTDKKVAAAKPKAKPYPLADGGGLYIEVLLSGSKVWRYSYGFNGKRTKVTIGPNAVNARVAFFCRPR
jgi:hypothetical protein